MFPTDKKTVPCSAFAPISRYLESLGAEGQRAKALMQNLGLFWLGGRPSRLTPTGAPVEFGFTQAGKGLRYTVEVAPPGRNPEKRLAQIERFLINREVPLPDKNLRSKLAAAQRSGPLTYGAWLGVRHDGPADSFKIYVEVPTGGGGRLDTWVTDLLGQPHRAPGPPPRIEMIGLDANGTRVEVYYASTDVLRTAVPILMDRAGLGADAMLSIIDSTTPFPSGARLPARDVGFSYAVTPGQPGVVFTLYFVAQKLFGDDAGCATWIAGRLPRYADFITHLPMGPLGTTHHGMIGLSMAPGLNQPVLSTGVAAPWVV